MVEVAGFAMIVYVVGLLLWLYAFIKTLASEFKKSSNKIIWVIALIFVPPSALLFPFIGLNQIK